MYPLLKRLIDVLVAALALVVLAPIMAAVALAIRVGDPGPVVFCQRRTGMAGRSFEIYKFRSMPVTTGDIPSDRLSNVKLTPIGRFLRRTNLDELPQLWNVLKGEMSLIGPRPCLPTQTELIALRRDHGALDCRPGLTGWAQVHSFDGMGVAQKVTYDAEYANRMSFWLDLLIIYKTFGYVMRPPPKY